MLMEWHDWSRSFVFVMSVIFKGVDGADSLCDLGMG